MYIVGFDPGTRFAGFSVVQVLGLHKFQIVEAGVWKLQGKESLGARLETLAQEVESLLKKYNPTYVGIEKAVVFKNPLSALKLSEARGVIRLVVHQTLESAESRLVEVSPTQVKKNISGFGNVKKSDVRQSVLRRFADVKINTNVQDSSDSYDAIAVALSVFNQIKKNQIMLKAASFKQNQ